MILPHLPPDRRDWANRLIKDRLERDFQEQLELDEVGFEKRFPPIVWVQHRDRCEQTMRELLAMAGDEYSHQLSELQQHALYQSLEGWLEADRDQLAGATPEDQPQDEAEVEALDELVDVAFRNTDFLHVEDIAKSVLEGTMYAPHLGIDPRDYLELMPDDIRARVERALSP